MMPLSVFHDIVAYHDMTRQAPFIYFIYYLSYYSMEITSLVICSFHCVQARLRMCIQPIDTHHISILSFADIAIRRLI